jgi:hypothetical protein
MIFIPRTEEALIQLSDDKLISTIEMRAWMEAMTAGMNLLPITVINVDGDFTTTGPGIYICNNSSPITITLNTTPSDGEQQIFKRRDALVNFTGTVDGSTSESLSAINVRYDLIYSNVTGDWNK